MTALIDPNGTITRWPTKAVEKKLVLDLLAEQFEPGRVYSEKEVNDILNRHHSFGDWALLRRELFSTGRLDRDARAGSYWLKARE